MLTSLGLLALASGSLVFGCLIGSFLRLRSEIVQLLLAFASGSLIAALATEIFPEAQKKGSTSLVCLATLLGAGAFCLANWWIDRVSSYRGSKKKTTPAQGGVGLLLLASVTLDGIPENVALGASLGDSSPWAFLIAVFASNFPEAIVGARALTEQGHSRVFTIGLWSATAVVLTLVGAIPLFLGVTHAALSFLLAFAGGANLASLADTLMPEAFERGRPWNAMSTVAGFLLSLVVHG